MLQTEERESPLAATVCSRQASRIAVLEFFRRTVFFY